MFASESIFYSYKFCTHLYFEILTVGIYQEMGSCCNRSWSSHFSLLGQKEDMVITAALFCLRKDLAVFHCVGHLG